VHMKAFRCTKQARRRRPRRTGARAPSPEYRIGDRHMRSQRAKQEIMLDHSIGVAAGKGDRATGSAYNKRGPRIHSEFHPRHVPARAVEQPCQAAFDLPPFMLAHDDDSLF
jgi:hypothetical protein